MADITPFSGFKDITGHLHSSKQGAIDATVEFKQLKALEVLAGGMTVYEDGTHFDMQEGQRLKDWLYENEKAILAALNQQCEI